MAKCGLTTGIRFLAGELCDSFSSPSGSDRLWGSSSLLSDGYGGPLPRG